MIYCYIKKFIRKKNVFFCKKKYFNIKVFMDFRGRINYFSIFFLYKICIYFK